MHWEDAGAFTGEISGQMLKGMGIKYCIIGHSERRTLFGETDEMVNKKVRKAIAIGLFPIMCIGETLEARESEKTFDVITRQLDGGLAQIGPDDMKKIVIAYEPVWAIGTGKNAAPAQAQEVHAFIRNSLEKKFGKAVADGIRIQYGGSVKPENSAELMAQKDIDGGLVGGASLEVNSFVGIVKNCRGV
jgi:triosephosphate isomerase